MVCICCVTESERSELVLKWKGFSYSRNAGTLWF